MRNLKKVAALLLVAAGVLVLVYRRVDYPAREHEAKLGPVKVSIEKTERIELPVWLGAALVAGGAVLLAFGKN